MRINQIGRELPRYWPASKAEKRTPHHKKNTRCQVPKQKASSRWQPKLHPGSWGNRETQDNLTSARNSFRRRSWIGKEYRRSNQRLGELVETSTARQNPTHIKRNWSTTWLSFRHSEHHKVQRKGTERSRVVGWYSGGDVIRKECLKMMSLCQSRRGSDDGKGRLKGTKAERERKAQHSERNLRFRQGTWGNLIRHTYSHGNRYGSETVFKCGVLDFVKECDTLCKKKWNLLMGEVAGDGAERNFNLIGTISKNKSRTYYMLWYLYLSLYMPSCAGWRWVSCRGV